MAFFMSTDVSLWMNFLLFAAYLEELSGDCGTFVILKDANKYSLLFIKWSYWDLGANKCQCLRLFQCHALALQPKLLAYFSSFRERGMHASNILPQNGGPVFRPTILFCHWIQFAPDSLDQCWLLKIPPQSIPLLLGILQCSLVNVNAANPHNQ